MSKAFSLFERLSIRQRIFGGFAVTLLLLAGLAALSQQAFNGVQSEAERVASAARLSAVVQTFSQQAEEARGATSDYVFTETDGDLQIARTELKQLEASAAPLSDVKGIEPALQAKLQDIRSAQGAFSAGVGEVFASVGARREHTGNLIKAATELKTLVSAIGSALQKENAPLPVIGTGMRLLEALQASNVGAVTFLSSRNPADASTAKAEIERLRSTLAALKEATPDSKRVQRFAAAIEEPLARFEAGINGLLAAAAKFGEASAGLDKAKKALFGAISDVSSRTAAGQTTAIESMIDTTVQAGRSGIATAGMALAGGIALAWLIGLSITRPLNALTDCMHRLAGGELETEIPASGNRNELGRMAEAVQVFRDAGRDKLRLEAETTQQRSESEAERGRSEAERADSARQQQLVVDSVATGLEKLSAGDLTFRIVGPFAPDYEKLRTDFNAAMAQLQQTMQTVTANTQGIQSGAGEISTAADDLSKRTEQQAATLEETAAALDEITATVGKTAQGADHALAVVSTAKDDAERSGEVVRKAMAAMSQIEKSSGQISQIIGVIDEIAFQTNLLALNAGVEAARAGDAGRGFAVVASEVRSLAQRSADAAKEIKGLILASTEQVASGVDLVGQTGQALARIVSQVADINGVVTDMAASAKEQSTALGEVNTAVNTMDQVTQQNAAMVEQSTAASHSLAREATDLAVLVGRFRVGDTAVVAPAIGKRVERAAPPARSAPKLKVVGSRTLSEPAPRQSADIEWEEF